MSDSTEVRSRGDAKPRWSGVAEIARQQDGVISHEQLIWAGYTRDEIKGLVKRGHLIRLHRGVHAVGHRCLSTKGHLRAALLATGPEAFLSHRTAAAVYGLRDVAIRRIDVTVPNGKRCSRGSLRLHQMSGEPDVKIRNGLRVSSVPQMLLELAPIEKQEELERLITWSVRKRILDLDEMRTALVRHHRRPGVSRLAGALGGYLPTHDRKSGLERDFDGFLREHPEIPEPRRNIYIDGWEIDCYWPEFKLAVELDGRPYHVAARDMEKDRVKDGKLLIIGVRPFRITDARFNHDQGGVYDDLVSLMRR